MTLNAVVDVPPLVDHGSIDVLDGDRLIGRVDLPLGAGGPISLPLTGVTIDRQVAVVTLRSTLVPFAGQCLVDWRDQPLRLHDPAVFYTGDERQPAVIADFLPPTLRTLTVYIPLKPSPVEIQSAMQVTTAVVAEYPGRQIGVRLRALPDGPLVADHIPDLLERQVAIREADAAQTQLVTDGPGPLLVLTGRGEHLADQVRLLTSSISALAVAPLAQASAMPARRQLAPETITLKDLGQNQLSNIGIGRVTVEAGIDQSRLGRSAHNVSIRLRGHYTPLPATWNGRLSVAVNGTEVDSWPVTGDGAIDRWISLPDNLLDRFTTVTVMLEAVGEQAGCGLERPVTLVIDSSSEVTSDASTPPVPGGFASLPQVLLPHVVFGLKTGDFFDAWRAVSIAAGLQRLTAVPLAPELKPFDSLVASTQSAVLISADQQIPDSVMLPLRQIEEGELALAVPEAGQPPTLQVTPGMSFGSLQTHFDGTRTILAATSVSAPGQLDAIIDWLNSDPQRWQKLAGDVVFKTGDRPPVMLTVGVTAPEPPATGPSMLVKLLTGAGVVLLLGGIGGATIVLRRRRKS